MLAPLGDPGGNPDRHERGVMASSTGGSVSTWLSTMTPGLSARDRNPFQQVFVFRVRLRVGLQDEHQAAKQPVVPGIPACQGPRVLLVREGLAGPGRVKEGDISAAQDDPDALEAACRGGD